MNSKLLTLVFAIVALAVSGQQKSAWSDAEAGKHVGEEAVVTGKVFTVSTSGKGTTFLNFGDRFPKHTFSGVIFARNQEAVGDVKPYEGKEVSLTGRIEMSPDQKPQIVISRPDQIKLAGAAIPSAPSPSAPVTTTPMPAPPAPSPPMSASGPSSRISAGKIQLAPGWNSPRRDGEMIRKDLARLFGASGTASENTQVDTATGIYPGVSFLTSLATAMTTLNLDGVQSLKSRVATPGFPQDSFSAHAFKGVFPGGFDHLYLVTDGADQVVSVLLVDSSSRTRAANEPDTTGYHTYNFVSGGGKAASHLVIRHQITPASAAAGVVVVDTLLIDPTDAEKESSSRPTKGSGKSSGAKAKTGKVLERSRWFVPAPIVNLILRCVGG